jgi:putative tricarboxylic transport membrane protein
MRRGDLAAGGTAVLLGAAALAYTTLTFPTLPGGHPGPGLFPQIVSALLVAFGAVLMWQARRPLPAAEADAAAATPRAPGAGLTVLLVLGAVVAYMVAVERIGFPITVALINLALMRRLGAGWAVALAAALLLGVGVYFLFARLLLVPLLPGPLPI